MLDTKQICLSAQSRLSPKGAEAGLYLPLVRAKLPQAINLLADRISTTPKRRLLQQTFTFAIDNTTALPSADISTGGVLAAAPLLLPFDANGNYIGFPSVQVGGVDCKPIADRHTLQKLRLNDGRIYYTVQDQVMLFAAPFALPANNVVIIGNYIPVIIQTLTSGQVTAETVSLPPELQDEIVAVLTGLFGALAPVDNGANDQQAPQQAA